MLIYIARHLRARFVPFINQLNLDFSTDTLPSHSKVSLNNSAQTFFLNTIRFLEYYKRTISLSLSVPYCIVRLPSEISFMALSVTVRSPSPPRVIYPTRSHSSALSRVSILRHIDDSRRKRCDYRKAAAFTRP